MFHHASTSRIVQRAVKCAQLTIALALLCASAHRVRADAVAPGPGGDISAKYRIDDSNPEHSVPTSAEAMKNPLEMGYLMMDLIARADAATQRGDHAAAVRYYRALGKAVPERSVSFAKLCKAYEALGDREQAVEACKLALGKGGVVLEDYARFVHLTLQQAEPLSPDQIEDIDAIVTHIGEQLKGDPQGPLSAALLACELGTRLEDTKRLEACSAQLAKLAPKDPRTLSFAWALALKQQDVPKAEQVLGDAKRGGLPAAALAAMETQLESARNAESTLAAMIRHWGAFGVLILAVAGLLFALALRRPEPHRAG